MALGNYALNGNTSGSNNIAVGNDALQSNSSGTYDGALGYYAGFQDSGGHFATGSGLQNAMALGAYAQVQASNSIVLGSIDTATKVGIGTTIPLNIFSVSPLDYNTGTACTTATSGGTTCAAGAYLYGTGTAWASTMVGDEVVFADGQEATITAFTSATAVSLSASLNEASGSYYRFHIVGLQLTTSGSVGIGTASPQKPLDVQGNGAANSTEYLLGAFDKTGSLGGAYLGYYTGSGGSIQEARVRSGGSVPLALGTTHYQQDLYILDTNGNVGLGTTSPQQPLDVWNNTASSAYEEAGRFVVNNGSGNYSRLLIGQNATNSMFIEVANQANTKGTLLAQPFGGSVAIGTTSASETLQVNGGILAGGSATYPDVTAQFASGNGGAFRWDCSNCGTDQKWSDLFESTTTIQGRFINDTYSSATAWIQAARGSGTAVASVDFPNGNVGVGTTNPATTLTVTGDRNIGSLWPGDSNYGQFYINGATNGNQRLALAYDTTNNVGLIQSQIYGTGAEYLSLNPKGGNVGIGTTSPGYGLDVNGTFHTSGNSVIGGQLTINTTSTHDALAVESFGGQPISESADNWTHSWRTGTYVGDTTYSYDIFAEGGGGPYFKDGGSGWLINSDQRLKTNIQSLPLSDSLNRLMQLSPISYTWKDVKLPQSDNLGFLAQQVQSEFPQLVNPGSDITINNSDGTQTIVHNALSLNYEGLIAPTVAAVQELNTIITTQQSSISALQNNHDFSWLNVSGNISVQSLTVSGPATFADITISGGATFNGSLVVNGHIMTGGGTPTAVITSNAGVDNNGTNNGTCSVSGNDTSGTLNITAGSTQIQSGAQCILTFTKPFGAAPHTVITPTSSSSVDAEAYITSTSTALTINFKQAPNARQVYSFNYWSAQ